MLSLATVFPTAFAPPAANLTAYEADRLAFERAEYGKFQRELDATKAPRPQPKFLSEAATDAPVQLIIDTDLGFDVDDVGAIAVANHLQDVGACKLLAVIHNTGFYKGIGGVDVINGHYGRPTATGMSLGAYKGTWGSSSSAQSAQDRYTSMIESNYPSPIQNYDQVDSAVTAYTKVLSRAADRSVVIASIGELTNLRDLLMANASLVGQKVKEVVYMDGGYNFGCGDAHGSGTSPWLGSTAGCDGAALYVTEHMPNTVRQLYTLNGGDVNTGGRFNDGCGHGPVKAAYQAWTGHGSRPSWDLIAVYLAVLGSSSLYSSERQGTDRVDAAGNEDFDTSDTSHNMAQVWIDSAHNGDVTRRLDDILCSAPCGGNSSGGPVGNCASYTMYSGHNCWGPGHGADEIENPPHSSCGTMSLAACQRRCDETANCAGVTVVATSGGLVECYRKANIDIGQCDYGDAWKFDTWLKKA